jgi:hypothetical protein
MKQAESNEEFVMEEDSVPSKRTGGSAPWVILGFAAVIVLAGAAFLAGRMFNQEEGPQGPSAGMFNMSGGPGGREVSLQIKRAKELPVENPTLNGVMQRKEDNSLFIGTGNVTVMLNGAEESVGDSDVQASFDGPVIEVVINRDTQIFRDITEMPFNKPKESTDIDQELEPGSVDELVKNSIISVWGEKQGDRIIADVIVYQ